ncbi:MAG TPA: hypothetical protein VFR90_00720 [Methylibium sp.]|uniref:hypothetical protein n=1 Tax=Methylibium sp. TaxID=2067992 RepID=UPI002DBEF7F4|nr:hypothetical protein [Methylibium sp.]HEU4457628.1 hypothetical protein [Methylibium sp.]
MNMPLPREATRAAAPRIELRRARGEGRAAARVDAALTAVMPPAARVLALGCAASGLREAYLREHPQARWHEADALPPGNAEAFDLIVLGPRLGHGGLAALPFDALFTALARHAAPNATLVLRAANGASLERIERIVEGDLSADDGGDGAAPSISSLYKRLMDAGWMPSLAGRRPAAPVQTATAQAALSIADALAIPHGTVERTLGIDEWIVTARRAFDAAPPGSTEGRFDVVVPVTRERQLRLNVEASPGLAEVEARIVVCRGAAHAAEALESSLPACEADWVLICHQDAFFPEGFGHRLAAVLAAVPAGERERTLIGFVGMGVNATTHDYEPAGFVVDRLETVDHPPSERAMSIDEVAIVVSRRSIHRIDPTFGWHLWATDLCLASICEHRQFARIVRLPLFHNSVTDYELPEAFMRSATTLAAKYPAFKSIPTLCATIDERFLARPADFVRVEAARPAASPAVAPPARAAMAASAEPPWRVRDRDLELPAATRTIQARIDAGDHEGATTGIVQAVHASYTQPGVRHRALYIPAFDDQMRQLAQALGREPGTARSGAPGVPLLIATELYDLGGHTRVLEEVSHEMKQPVLVLTDLFRNGARDPARIDALRQRFAHTQFIVLPDVPLWEKCRMLRQLVLRLVPRATLYFNHHQDPIPFIGTLAQPGPRRLFMHHGDHNPSLGCTLPDVRHVDLISSLQALCGERRAEPATWLALFVADQGRKAFPKPVADRGYGVATAGHPAKFARDGALSLQRIAATALSAIDGRHFHIGPLDDGWLADIRAHLEACGIAGDRFVSLGTVPSVWRTLKTIDAAVYIGSAPVSGGRSAIEAQGCGLPTLCYRGFDEGSLLADYSSYADPEWGWASLDELAARLARLGEPGTHARLSQRARAFYDDGFSRKRFKRTLQALVGA